MYHFNVAEVKFGLGSELDQRYRYCQASPNAEVKYGVQLGPFSTP
jgi:hypothetical protein